MESLTYNRTAMDSVIGQKARMVPLLQYYWEDLEDNTGLVINDIFLGFNEPLSPATPQCVVFVDQDQSQDMNSDELQPKFNSTQQTHYNSTAISLSESHQEGGNRWFDDYVNLNEETFGSSRPLPPDAQFPSQPSFSNCYDETEVFHSNPCFHQLDHQVQNSSGPSSGSATVQFSQINLQEPSFRMEDIHPPISESEYSASYSRPGSTYSSDWNNISDNSSVQSRDEILEEIQRECAEIERNSVTPPLRQKTPRYTASNRSSARRITLLGLNSEKKKELNRIAATKYRNKKRREKEMLSMEYKQLENVRNQLHATARELTCEVNYLKKLMKDMEMRSRQ